MTTRQRALTQRQRDVLDLLVQDKTNRQIARALGISAHTVKFHVQSACEALDVRSRVGAAVAWARFALTPTCGP